MMFKCFRPSRGVEVRLLLGGGPTGAPPVFFGPHIAQISENLSLKGHNLIKIYEN